MPTDSGGYRVGFSYVGFSYCRQILMPSLVVHLYYSKNRNERGKVRNERGNLWYQNVVFFGTFYHCILIF